MGGNIAAFATKADAEKLAEEKQVKVEDWEMVSKSNHSGDDGHDH